MPLTIGATHAKARTSLLLFFLKYTHLDGSFLAPARPARRRTRVRPPGRPWGLFAHSAAFGHGADEEVRVTPGTADAPPPLSPAAIDERPERRIYF